VKLNPAQQTAIQEGISTAGRTSSKRSRPRIADETGIDIEVLKAIKNPGSAVQVTASELKALCAALGLDYKTIRGLS
jgi:hypothetical protein